jgi:hypothetical protein
VAVLSTGLGGPALFLVNAFEAVKGSAHGAPALPSEDGYFTQGD